MPKKTKREKIISDYRKRLKLLQDNNIQVEPKVEETKSKIIESENDLRTTDYFKKDFGKSLILITAVIALEISLYFARIIK